MALEVNAAYKSTRHVENKTNTHRNENSATYQLIKQEAIAANFEAKEQALDLFYAMCTRI